MSVPLNLISEAVRKDAASGSGCRRVSGGPAGQADFRKNRYVPCLAPLALRGCPTRLPKPESTNASGMALSNRGIKIKALGESCLA